MIEEHIRGDSIIHKLDVRIKIIYALIFSITIAIQNDFGSNLAGLFVGILFIVLAQISIKEILKRLLVIDEFILLLWVILPLTYPGNTFYKIFGLNISTEGILFTLLLTIKANAIMLILTSLIATSSILDIVHGLMHLKIPEKLVFLFFLMYRYSWLLSEEYERMSRALKARVFKLRNSLHTYRIIAYIIGGLLVKSYNRAQNLYRAMVARGFTGKFWLLDHFKFSALDIGGIFILTAFDLIIIIL